MIYEVMKHYKIDKNQTPLFLLGRSFGGLIATNLVGLNADVCHEMFSGIILIAPFFDLFEKGSL